jgi:hypothetical protein
LNGISAVLVSRVWNGEKLSLVESSADQNLRLASERVFQIKKQSSWIAIVEREFLCRGRDYEEGKVVGATTKMGKTLEKCLTASRQKAI